MENLPTPKQLIDEVKKALDAVKENSPHLFTTDIHEITLVHQVACTLKGCQFLSGYSIDLEYNRITGINSDQVIKKTFKEDPNDLFRPDLIIHIPRTQLANLLVVEFSKGKDNKREESKLKELTKRDGKYGYRIGILIDIPKYETWQFFINGESFNYQGAEKILDDLEREAHSALNCFKDINLNYRIGEEDYEESKRVVETARSSGNDWNWDEASNASEMIYNRNKEALMDDCMNFQCCFKKYFQSVFIPEYLRCSEIIDHLYKNTLKDVERDYSDIFLGNDNWFLYSEETFSLICKLCLYCHYSIYDSKSNRKKEIFSELEEEFKFFNNLDGSLDF